MDSHIQTKSGTDRLAANNKRIAAAPDLAAALQRLVNWHDNHELDVGLLVQALHCARAALSKAGMEG